MASAVLAVALDESSAAPAFAQRLAAEAGAPACLVLPARAPIPSGRWETAWRIARPSPPALVRALSEVAASRPFAALVLDDAAAQREVAGRLAIVLGTPVIGAVVAVRSRDATLHVTRHAAAGEATVTFNVLRQPAILLLDREAVAGSTTTAAGVVSHEYHLEPRAVPGETLQLLRETRLLPWEMQVTDADVVVAGGRGIGGPEGFDMLARLAARLGGTVAGTRVAVDNGWIPYARQVGLTGKTVTPALYIACGISGAVHHTLGMRGSSRVIAINTDREAPIFKLATVSVIADVHDLIPRLLERIEAVAGTPALAGAAP